MRNEIPDEVFIGGVDEAGRGPVLGPLVVACIAIKPENEVILLEVGVKDSKALTVKQRDEKAALLRKHPSVRCAVIILDANELDTLRSTRTLNDIEAELFAQAIKKCLGLYHSPSDDTNSSEPATLLPTRIFVDAADVNTEHFKQRILFYLGEPFPLEIVSEHKADANYPIVAAASILAKTVRDAKVAEIREELKMEIGSGYPSDERTITFLREWLELHHSLPPHTRKSWETARRLLHDHKYRPTTLTDFFKWDGC